MLFMHVGSTKTECKSLNLALVKNLANLSTEVQRVRKTEETEQMVDKSGRPDKHL